MQRMNTTQFTTAEVGTRPQISYPNSKRTTHDKGKKKRIWPSPLLVKVGICVAACAMMFTMKALEVPAAQEVVANVKSAVDEKTDLTEMLGKLQFVELPNALEVFSGNTQMILPVSAPHLSISDDSSYAEWEGAPNANVVAAAAGEVRAIGEDAVLGPYVRLKHSGELETIYYGLNTIKVEQGQPIRRQDTLGTLGEEGILRLCVLLAGQPQPPASYLNIRS